MKAILNDWYVLLFVEGFFTLALCAVEGLFEWLDRRRARKATEDFEKWMRSVTLFDQDQEA